MFVKSYYMLQINADSITHKFQGQAYHWLVTTGPKIIIAIIILFIGQWIIKVINKGLKKILFAKRFNPTLQPFIQNLVHTVLQVLLVLLVMQVLGIQLTLFAAVIASFGVAAGLALSGTLQNFASGVLIILLKPFGVGDNIKTQGEEGTVTAIRLFYTVVRTFTNTTLIVPNSKLSNDVIFNNTREATRRVDITIKFKYTVDFKDVQKTILASIGFFDSGLKDPAPRIGIDKVEPDGYSILINVWVNSHGYQDARFELNERLMNALRPFFMPREN